MAAPALRSDTISFRDFPRLVETKDVPSALKSSCGPTVRIFGLSICDTNLDAAARWLVQRAGAKVVTNVAFVNAHSINTMNRDVRFADAVSRFHCIFADGIGLRWAAKAAGITLRDNVNGTDLFPLVCQEAARKDVWIYLLGSDTGVSDATARNMTRDYPGLTIAGSASGYFADAEEENRAIDAINASGAEILLVGMGVPRQEKWILENRHRLKPSVLIGVGGLFDYYSGNIARAPMLLRKRGLEWAWRLALEPKRLAQRYLIGNAEFLLRLATHRLLSPQLFDQSATSVSIATAQASK
jgi:exopolysaccharide biosynthesis WecB/TagA/CpsF family protein